METRVYLTILFDYYEKLLTEKDKNCFKDYYFENLSLGEIAENYNLSRNAVHKRLKKIEEELKDYESKIGLYKKEQQVLSMIEDERLKEKVKKIFE